MPEISNPERSRDYQRKSEELQNMLPRKLQRHRATPLAERPKPTTNVPMYTNHRPTDPVSGKIIELRYDLIARRGYVGNSRHESSHPPTTKLRRSTSQHPSNNGTKILNCLSFASLQRNKIRHINKYSSLISQFEHIRFLISTKRKTVRFDRKPRP